MALCRTVATLATQLEMQIENLQTDHSNMLSVMKNMPSYLERGDLSLWEADYRESIGDNEDESSKEYKAIDLLYELAGLNLFGAFQKSKTKRVYAFVVSELARLDISVSKDMDVSQW